MDPKPTHQARTQMTAMIAGLPPSSISSAPCLAQKLRASSLRS